MAEYDKPRTGGAAPSSGGSIVEWAQRVFTPKAGPASVKLPPRVPAPDGYIRKTPVQEIRVPEGYKRRMIMRAIGITLGILLAAAVIYILFTFILNLL